MLRGLKRLNRYEKRLIEIAKKGGSLVRISQFGFSSKTEQGFRFPIYSLEIGKEKAVRKNPAGLIAGVHGLETIGIRVLLDFLEFVLEDGASPILKDLKKGEFGIVCIPILNPGGVAMKRRSNPRGVDLMRNSGLKAEDAPFFFGGQNFSNKLPYYQGKTLEAESRVLYRFAKEYFFQPDKSIIPVLDIHSGFGMTDHIWWPYAKSQEKCPDDALYMKLAQYLKEEKNHQSYKFGPQSETYTINGDLWDRLYEKYRKEKADADQNWKARFLPVTLEIGTWSDITGDPLKIFRKRGIFNPSRDNKHDIIMKHRHFLSDLVRLASSRLKDWV